MSVFDRIRVNRDGLFAARPPDSDLAGRSVRGGAATVGGQLVMFGISLLRTVVLARLLLPADFGLVSMVAAVVNFAAVFRDAGLTLATVQRSVISRAQVTNLFWVNVAFGIGLFLAMTMCAPAVAAFYGRPELSGVTAAMAGTFLLSGFTIQHQALLQRHLRFGLLAGIQVCAHGISFLTAVALAWAGWRYWALVAGTLAHALAVSGLTWLACPWTPGRPVARAGVRDLVRFGGQLAGFNCINYFARNMDNVLIGRVIGAAALGVYDRAYQILLLPITLMSGPLGNAALPVLCRLQDDRPRLHRYYLRILYLLALAACPIAGFSFVASDAIVLLLLGDAWQDVGVVFRYLALGALLQPLYFTQAWLHVATGRSDRVLRWGLAATPLIVGAFVAGLPWGASGVALAYSLAMLLLTPAALAYGGFSAGLTLRRMAGAAGRPLLACAGAMALGALAPVGVAAGRALPALAWQGLVFGVAYGALLVALYRGIGPVRDVLDVIRRLRGGKRSGDRSPASGAP